MGDHLLLDAFVNGIPSKQVEPWRAGIRTAVEQSTTEHPAGPTQPSGPVAVELYFSLPRPAGHYRTGRNAGTLRDTAPRYPAGRPELDKLVRAVLDAAGSTGRVWTDDSQVAHINTWKTYADHTIGEPVGVQITVRSLA